MAPSGPKDLNALQMKALEYATFADDRLRNQKTTDPAAVAAGLAVYYQLRSVTEDPDMAEAMRELAAALRQNSAAREEFGN